MEKWITLIQSALNARKGGKQLKADEVSTFCKFVGERTGETDTLIL